METTRGNHVARAMFGTVRKLGTLTRSACSGLQGVGRLIGGSPRILARFSGLTKSSARKEKIFSELEREGIRSVVIEMLARVQSGKRIYSLPKYEKRLQRMAETIGALQKTIDQMNTRGLSGETIVSTVAASIRGQKSLSDEERAVLTSIFRQNLEIQKPNLINTGADRLGESRRQEPLAQLSG